MHRNTRPRSMDGGRGVECVAGIFDQSVTRSDVPSFAPSAAWIATWGTRRGPDRAANEFERVD
jgi:hypothetical protein